MLARAQEARVHLKPTLLVNTLRKKPPTHMINLLRLTRLAARLGGVGWLGLV